MSTTIIAIIAVAGLIVAWFVWSISWTRKQTLLGTWVAALPDGTHVTIQFEGERAGGIYKQLSKRDEVELREFGHWTIKFLDLHLLMMATDVKQHSRFGVDTKYWVTFHNDKQMTINGPERPKWHFQRAAEGVKLDFDVPKTAA